MTKTPPTIAELTAGYLGRTADAETLISAVDALGDVEPHEVSVGLRAEPRLAWQESLEVLSYLVPTRASLSAPAEWGGLVVRQKAVSALPFSLGSYPQRVRELTSLLQARDLKTLLPKTVESGTAPSGLVRWANAQIERKELPHALIAAAIFRCANDFENAEATLKSLGGSIDPQWAAVLENERAALAWERGDFQTARAFWAAMPESAPVLFNRGMAELFLGSRLAAAKSLRAAAAMLPETSAWHHLANLYLVVSEM
jgi:tetratricopeptide (TPR) repeat protein